jgi:hypothetical protein
MTLDISRHERMTYRKPVSINKCAGESLYQWGTISPKKFLKWFETWLRRWEKCVEREREEGGDSSKVKTVCALCFNNNFLD